MARMPQLFGAIHCVESEKLALIRTAIGTEAGLSCCRAGAPGPWSKDTILFLDHLAQPLLIVKAGKGEAVDRLLRNETEWLRELRNQPQLAAHLPELVAHRSGMDLSFVAQSVLPGRSEFELGKPHFEFLRKFQAYSRRSLRYEESGMWRNMHTRMRALDGLLSKAWGLRIEKAMRRIEEQLCGAPILMTAAHNDFTPWNIRIQDGVARIFDWEYAEAEQLPLFDPLHFALMPMALKRERPETMIRVMRQTQQLCERWLGKEFCHAAQTQALACLVNICMIYLLSVRGESVSSPVFDSYIPIIDQMCLL